MRTLVMTAAAVTVAAAGIGQAAEPVKIGALLSYSGTYASIGEEITNAMELAFADAGGEVAGRKIQIVRADTEVKPNVALAKARELVGSDNVDIMVGPVSSSESAALRDFVAQSHVPLLLPNAAASPLLGAKCSPYLIRTSFSERQFTFPFGPWLVAQGVKTAYTLAPDYVGPRELMDLFAKSFTEAGGKMIGAEFTPFGKTTDFAPYLARIKQEKPQALFVFYSGSEGINFIKQAADFGLRDSVKMTGPGWIVSPLLLPAEGDAALGFIGLLNYAPSLDTPVNKKFQEEYQAKYHRVASEFGAQGYETAEFIIEALKATGGKTDDKAALARALRSAKIVGPRGPLFIDPETNSVVQNMYVVQVVKGASSPELKVIDTFPAVKDPPSGCELKY